MSIRRDKVLSRAYHKVIAEWNEHSDEFNQWTELDWVEKTGSVKPDDVHTARLVAMDKYIEHKNTIDERISLE